MIRILFVDDEPHVLSALRRQLRARSQEWQLEFVGGAAQALDALERGPFDVIVTDIRMPGIDGAELLAHVRSRWPAMVRFVLSGHSDREQVLRTVNEAHQYLAKPCDPAVLQATLDRAIELRRLVKDPRLVEVVSSLGNLPTLPEVYTEITEALRDETLSLPDLGAIVGKDMALSAKILQVVNSAFFMLPRHLASPGEAAVVLGIDVLRSLALGCKLFTSFRGPASAFARVQSTWLHSQRVAVLAQRLARDLGLDRGQQEMAFTGGLLHDVGDLLLILAQDPKRPLPILPESAGAWREVQEREQFGASHAEVGAYLLGLWGLPDDIVAAVAYHHRPEAQAPLRREPVTAVHLAVCLEHGHEPDERLLTALDAQQIYAYRKSLAATETNDDP